MVEYVVIHVPVMSDAILMIRKNHPDWQAGKLNFPGGHIEEGEQPEHAAYRELYEETGLVAHKMLEVGRIRSDTALVHVFTLFGRSGEAQQRTDESLEIVRVVDLPFRSDLVDRNIILMCGLIDGGMSNWDIHHETDRYRIEIPYK
jgi:8-oxo-dGTP pyrophosphatase MutT (NUDIX family)